MKLIELLNRATESLKRGGVERPRLNAELLLAHALKLSREGLYMRLNEEAGDEGAATFQALLQRRLLREPLQYILGRQEFRSLDFHVDRRVLIPRPETELLVEEAILVLSSLPEERRPYVLDLGTGSGALALSLLKERKGILVVATDISGEALAVAKHNARRMGVLDALMLVRGDLFGPFRLRQEGIFDLILSNPPYVPRAEVKRLPREIRQYEPRMALDGGGDGMDFHRALIRQASEYLKRGGWVLVEVGAGQRKEVESLFCEQGLFSNVEVRKDFSGIDRVIKAQKME